MLTTLRIAEVSGSENAEAPRYSSEQPLADEPSPLYAHLYLIIPPELKTGWAEGMACRGRINQPADLGVISAISHPKLRLRSTPSYSVSAPAPLEHVRSPFLRFIPPPFGRWRWFHAYLPS